MDFGKRFSELLEKKGMSGRELARTIGVSSGAISGWRNGAFPTVDKAIEIARIFDMSVEELVNGHTTFTNPENGKSITLGKNYFLVPILDQELSAGYGAVLPDSDEKVGLMPVPKELSFLGEKLGVLVVHGDSMEPTFKNGTPVLCDSKGWDNEEGVYAIRLNGKGYIKRIQVGVGKIIIKSDNPKYSPIEEPIGSDDFNIIGRVWFAIDKVC